MKPLVEFHKNRAHYTGYGYRCKECGRLRMGGDKKKKRGWAKLTHAEMVVIMNSRTDCIYCHIPFGYDFYSKKTRDRKDSSRGYEFENVVLACYRCNMIKSDALNYEDMLYLGPIIRNLIEKRATRNTHA